jgi:histone H3
MYIPAVGADFLAAFEASCFRGALPPVDFRAVCLVRAIFLIIIVKK